ncbi:MAG: MASE3 domain-containing protein [Thermodesulfobacteriota bacterium]
MSQRPAQTSDPLVSWRQVFFWLLVFAGLFWARQQSYLLFHGLVEGFCMVVAGSIFLLAWNARRFLDNGYLVFLGTAYAFTAGLDLLHTLAYKGMGVFPDYDANLPTQLWIASRYLLAISFLLAPWFLGRKVRAKWPVLAYGAVTALLVWSIFGGAFPDCYREGQGLTGFKVASEYLTMAMFAGAMLLLRVRREQFSSSVHRALLASLALSIAAGLAFTLYVGVYDLPNQVGHLFKLLAYFFVYKALIETGLRRPYELLFLELKQSEQALKASEETWRALLNAPHESAILLDRDLRVRAVNQVAAQRLGGSVEELIGRDFLELMTPDVKENRRERLMQVLATGQPQHFQDNRLGRDYDLSFYPLGREGRAAGGVAIFGQDITLRLAAEREREEMVTRLTQALAEVKTLSGLLPICASCKRVRDDKGYWNQIEAYISRHSQAEFSHSICPDCARRLYPDLMDKES